MVIVKWAGRDNAVSAPDRIRDAESPQEINPQVPAGLSSLVMDCCRNGAANRPAMREVLDRFRAVAHALKIVRE